MPIIKSAIKKMRQDKAREKANRDKKDALKQVLKKATLKPSSENLSKAFSSLDRAAKKGLLPRGRANRRKSQLAKNLKIEAPKAAKKTSPKRKSVVVKSK